MHVSALIIPPLTTILLQDYPPSTTICAIVLSATPAVGNAAYEMITAHIDVIAQSHS